MAYIFQKFYRNTQASIPLIKRACFIFITCFSICCTTNETNKEASKRINSLQDKIKFESENLKKTKPRIAVLQHHIVVLNKYFTEKKERPFTGILEALHTANNYVVEFEKELQEIEDEIAFTKKQLTDLKDDIKSNIYTPETISNYLFDEQTSIEYIQGKIKFLVMRLETQEFFVESLKNEFNIDLSLRES